MSKVSTPGGDNYNDSGNIRPIIYSDYQGFRFVAVGDMLIWSNKYKTFIDFLADYGKTIIESRLRTPIDNSHEIVKWYESMRKFQASQKPDANGIAFSPPNGTMMAFIHLAYELYLLQHHMLLQDRIIQRLGNKDQFQGVRYELFAISTCIRAGFNIELKNDSEDIEKHSEFIATHRFTGQRIEIEAKSRHRDGVLGYKSNEKQKESEDKGFGRKIKDAFKKQVTNPYVIFVDLNLSPNEHLPEGTVMYDAVQKEVRNAFGRINIYDPYNLIIVTNHPYHFDISGKQAPSGASLFIPAFNPRIKMDHPLVLRDIWISVMNYRNIPLYFKK